MRRIKKILVGVFVPFIIFAVVLEVATRIVDSKIHYLIPRELDFKGLSEWKAPKGYDLYNPTQDASYNGHSIHINALGFRGPEFDLEESRDALRILVIGDSLTFGQGVAEEEMYTTLVEKELNERYPGQRIMVINASNQGAGMKDEVNMFIDFYDVFKPHIVVFGFFYNDIKNSSLASTMVSSRKWRSLWAFSKLLQHSLIVAGMFPDFYQDMKPRYEADHPDWHAFQDTLDTLVRFREERGGFPIVMMYLDLITKVRSKYADFLHDSKITLKNELQERGISFVDTYRALKDGGEKNYSLNRWDYHPNAKANEIYANVLVDYLVDQHLIDHAISRMKRSADESYAVRN